MIPMNLRLRLSPDEQAELDAYIQAHRRKCLEAYGSYLFKLHMEGRFMIKYAPVDDYIWLQEDELKMTQGGLHLPDRKRGETGPEKYRNGMGLVLAVGPGGINHFNSDQRLPMPCKPGDRILFHPRPSMIHNPQSPNEDIIMIQAEQVIAVVTGEPPDAYKVKGDYDSAADNPLVRDDSIGKHTLLGGCSSGAQPTA